MSHFVVLVLSPEKPENPNDYIDELLAPYSEHVEVDAYEEDCWCVGRIAKREASEQAAEELEPISLIREKYHAVLDSMVRTKMGGEEYSHSKAEEWFKAREQADKEITPTWEERIQPILDREKELEDQHPLKGKPDAGCEECNGSGKTESTYNPKSKWDWYQIGGRWSGLLNPDYDPAEDPRNQEVCRQCHGTGKRNDALGQSQRAKDPTYTCNGCDGKGQSTKWPTEWVTEEDGNIAPVATILKHLDDGHNILPFALVRPTGEWLEKGNMGWWAMVSNEKENWPEAARAVLEEYQDSWGIVVDCHI